MLRRTPYAAPSPGSSTPLAEQVPDLAPSWDLIERDVGHVPLPHPAFGLASARRLRTAQLSITRNGATNKSRRFARYWSTDRRYNRPINCQNTDQITPQIIRHLSFGQVPATGDDRHTIGMQ